MPRGFALTAVSDIIPGLQILCLLVASIQNMAAARSRLRAFWGFQTLCWLIDQSSWIYFEVFLRKSVPELYIGDLFPFLRTVPILAGFLLRPHLEPSQSRVRLGILDFLQLMLWWIFTYVYWVICWQYVSIHLDAYNANYDRLYNVGGLFVVLVLIFPVFQSRGKWRRFYAFYLGSFVFYSLSLQAANSAIETGHYYSGCWFDSLVLVSLTLFMVTTAMGRDLAPAPETPRDSRFAAWTARLAVVAVLSLPVILAASVFEASASHNVFRFRVAVACITILAMTILLLIKQRRLHQELLRTNDNLAEACLTDPLTGIRNRRYFHATVERDVAQCLRAYSTGQNSSSTCDLIFYLIDLDDFKQVNDLFGHDAGDRVLIETTRRIGSVMRDSDVLHRWGGEEFLIVSRIADRRHAHVLAERVLQAVRETPFRIDETHQIQRTCSVGWAAFPQFEGDPAAIGYDRIMSLADQALREAKKAGKNRSLGSTSMGFTSSDAVMSD